MRYTKKTTIYEIAKRLGVSTSTVSRALTGHKDIKDSTKQKIMALSEQLGYRPDPFAVSLRKKSSRTIGIIVPKITNSFFSRVISGLQDEAIKNNYNVVISQTEESMLQEIKNIETFMENQLAGLIASLSIQTDNYSHFEKIIDNKYPIVLFDRVNENLNTSRVIIDDYDASFRAVTHLIEQGCKNIAHIAGPQNLLNTKTRLKGYRDALKSSNLQCDEELILHANDYSNVKVEKMVNQLLKLPHGIDGIFALNDITALKIIQILKRKGFAIPEDIAIVGFNNDQASKYTDPPITSVESPAELMGATAFQALLRHIEDENMGIITHTLKSKLIIRKSSLKNKS